MDRQPGAGTGNRQNLPCQGEVPQCAHWGGGVECRDRAPPGKRGAGRRPRLFQRPEAGADPSSAACRRLLLPLAGEVGWEANKKARPKRPLTLGQDRILRCHPAWRNPSRPLMRTNIRRPGSRGVRPSHILRARPLSARPQKPIQSPAFCRPSTAGGSLEKGVRESTYASSTV